MSEIAVPPRTRTNDPATDKVLMEIGRRAKAELGLNAASVAIDLGVVHLNGQKLRLQALLEAGAASFAHDVAGVARYLDRSSGKLLDGFRPHCADSPEQARAEGRAIVATPELIELAVTFMERAQVVRHSGEQRDRAAVEFFCGAAATAAALEHTEVSRNLGAFVSVLSQLGYAGIEAALQMIEKGRAGSLGPDEPPPRAA